MDAAFDSFFFRAYLEELLRRWLQAAVTPSGFFRPRIDARWRVNTNRLKALRTDIRTSRLGSPASSRPSGSAAEGSAIS